MPTSRGRSGIRKVNLIICHHILPSPAIPEDDLPGPGQFRQTTSRNRPGPGKSSSGILGLERIRWQIFKLTYRTPDRPRLVGIVYVFVTGALFQIRVLSTEEYFTGGHNNYQLIYGKSNIIFGSHIIDIHNYRERSFFSNR